MNRIMDVVRALMPTGNKVYGRKSIAASLRMNRARNTYDRDAGLNAALLAMRSSAL